MRDRRFDRLLPPLFARDTGCSMNSIDDLVSGYRRFRKGAYSTQRARFDVLANQGQSPKVMVIACSDSRVDPTMIFDSGPGEMFVVRNIANLVPPFETGGGRHGVSAALEFAVTQLEVSDIVILGHGGRSEEHTSELQSLMRISYAVFCLKKKTQTQTKQQIHIYYIITIIQYNSTTISSH